LVSTPTRIRQHLDQGNVNLRESLESLVIDEADLILSYGYDDDVTSILNYLPQIYQSYLMSATLSAVCYIHVGCREAQETRLA
jgi:ATP-dependent RNA helicase DDX56/DBP9